MGDGAQEGIRIACERLAELLLSDRAAVYIREGLSVSRRLGFILTYACAFLGPNSLWAKDLLIDRDTSLFFAASDAVLDRTLIIRRISQDESLFPKRNGDTFGVYSGLANCFHDGDSVPAISSVLSSGFVDPWLEEPAYSNRTNIAAPGALEAEWEAPRQVGYSWGGAIGQTLLFMTMGHVFRIATEEKTRRELDGPFFKDWLNSSKALFNSGWNDGGRDFTNYVVHPLSGAVYGHIYRQNHPQDKDVRIAFNQEYLGHLGKTTIFSFVASMAWEIGPYSEASIGNVGLRNTPESQQMAWVDVVVTPILGVWGVMMIEDLFEELVIRKVEARTANRWIKALVRIPLTPTRSMANLMAIKRPDYRPDRQ